jgi:hypothetical protein
MQQVRKGEEMWWYLFYSENLSPNLIKRKKDNVCKYRDIQPLEKQDFTYTDPQILVTTSGLKVHLGLHSEKKLKGMHLINSIVPPRKNSIWKLDKFTYNTLRKQQLSPTIPTTHSFLFKFPYM